MPEFEKTYPEPQKFGVLPSYGFFIRHVNGIKLNNVEISYLGKETRPAFFLDDVKGAELRNVKAQTVNGVSTFVMKNVSNFDIKDSKGFKDAIMPNVVNGKL